MVRNSGQHLGFARSAEALLAGEEDRGVRVADDVEQGAVRGHLQDAVALLEFDFEFCQALVRPPGAPCPATATCCSSAWLASAGSGEHTAL